ncbi:hypothetical protein [Aureitalea marina]|uniref:Uncharacterized protein n=1 Tax=Aureitalea marina TaxID=930804 RepID=A0A2S7KQA0_9FLAO|nr:hypothetical protein [Aureitalea marina]PQB04809.1 hypothetical protein BST85_07785 [Aureitalea marina]
MILGLMIFLVSLGNLQAQEEVSEEKASKDPYAYIDSSKVYLDVVERGYRSPQVLQKLADSYYFKSEYAEALRWYQELFSSYPNEAYPETLSEDYYLRAARSAKAISNKELAVELIGQYSAMGGDPKLVQAFLK